MFTLQDFKFKCPIVAKSLNQVKIVERKFEEETNTKKLAKKIIREDFDTLSKLGVGTYINLILWPFS